jgi:hypothetical protein
MTAGVLLPVGTSGFEGSSMMISRYDVGFNSGESVAMSYLVATGAISIEPPRASCSRPSSSVALQVRSQSGSPRTD